MTLEDRVRRLEAWIINNIIYREREKKLYRDLPNTEFDDEQIKAWFAAPPTQEELDRATTLLIYGE